MLSQKTTSTAARTALVVGVGALAACSAAPQQTTPAPTTPVLEQEPPDEVPAQPAPGETDDPTDTGAPLDRGENAPSSRPAAQPFPLLPVPGLTPPASGDTAPRRPSQGPTSTPTPTPTAPSTPPSTPTPTPSRSPRPTETPSPTRPAWPSFPPLSLPTPSPTRTPTPTPTARTDTRPPSAVSALRVLGLPEAQCTRGTTSYTVLWNAATDDVGVVDHRVRVDNAAARTVKGRAVTLRCPAEPSTVRVEVAARDEAGNVGPATSLTVRTGSSSPSPTPSSRPSPSGSPSTSSPTATGPTP